MKEDKGITRRQFIQVSSSLAVAGVLPEIALAQAKSGVTPLKKSGTRLILLGTGGGPRPNKMRNQSA